jgi:hypothetical protein
MLIRYGLITLLLPAVFWGSDQSAGAMGNKIAVDQFGGIHAVWMKGIGGIRPRYVYYNFRSEVDSSWTHNPDGTAISGVNGTGYVTLDLLAGGETIAAYHSADAIPAHPIVGIDAFRGFGIFNEYNVNPSVGSIIPHIARNVIIPHIARNVDSGRLHMITTSPDGAFALQYTYSADDGVTWSDYIWVDTADIMGYIIVASPVSDKTAILYCKQDITERFYDVFFSESVDGISWDFRYPINITQFTSNDSLSAWTDIDAVYDYYDNIHIVYQAALIQGGDISLNNTQLRHWSENSGHSVITTGPDSGCARVAGCLCVAYPNLGVNSDNYLFAVWSEMDFNNVSAGGYSIGELYFSYSWDQGELWYPKMNITNSPTPNCPPGYCDSDVWVSLAEKVDDFTLHILYIDDNDAGDAGYGQGIWTINAVLYHQMHLLSLDDPGAELPAGFKLLRAYPNPFNASTTIEFALAEPGDAELTIYDITGSKVETIRRPGLEPGRHSVVWDAKEVASGVYFARMEVGEDSRSIKMVLLK